MCGGVKFSGTLKDTTADGMTPFSDIRRSRQIVRFFGSTTDAISSVSAWYVGDISTNGRLVRVKEAQEADTGIARGRPTCVARDLNLVPNLNIPRNQRRELTRVRMAAPHGAQGKRKDRVNQH
jgi:hypothetical protein